MIFTVTLNPAVDKTVVLPGFTIGRVNRIKEMRLDPGGKGINVSKVIQGLGGKSIAMGILGGETGKFIQATLDEAGIAHDFLVVGESTRTNLKVIDPESDTHTDINEPGFPVNDERIESVFAKLEARVRPGDIVVLAGKCPPGVADDLYGKWTKRLHMLDLKVFLDAEGGLLSQSIAAKPELIKPNAEEFAGLMKAYFDSIAGMTKSAQTLLDQGVGEIAISLGEKGALFIKKGQSIYARGLKVKVRSTVGAGDATLAALALGSARGDSREETIRMAVAAGAASVMCEGTEGVSRETVEMLMKQVHLEE